MAVHRRTPVSHLAAPCASVLPHFQTHCLVGNQICIFMPFIDVLNVGFGVVFLSAYVCYLEKCSLPPCRSRQPCTCLVVLPESGIECLSQVQAQARVRRRRRDPCSAAAPWTRSTALPCAYAGHCASARPPGAHVSGFTIICNRIERKFHKTNSVSPPAALPCIPLVYSPVAAYAIAVDVSAECMPSITSPHMRDPSK